MAIDSTAKRKSIAAIGMIMVGPVVVPDAAFSAADRQVIGYSYSGIAAGAAVDVSAGHICIRNVSLNIASATTAIKIAPATTSIEVC